MVANKVWELITCSSSLLYLVYIPITAMQIRSVHWWLCCDFPCDLPLSCVSVSHLLSRRRPKNHRGHAGKSGWCPLPGFSPLFPRLFPRMSHGSRAFSQGAGANVDMLAASRDWTLDFWTRTWTWTWTRTWIRIRTLGYMVLGDGKWVGEWKWVMGDGWWGNGEWANPYPLTSLGRLFVILPLGHLRQQCHLPENSRRRRSHPASQPASHPQRGIPFPSPCCLPAPGKSLSEWTAPTHSPVWVW